MRCWAKTSLSVALTVWESSLWRSPTIAAAIPQQSLPGSEAEEHTSREASTHQQWPALQASLCRLLLLDRCKEAQSQAHTHKHMGTGKKTPIGSFLQNARSCTRAKNSMQERWAVLAKQKTCSAVYLVQKGDIKRFPRNTGRQAKLPPIYSQLRPNATKPRRITKHPAIPPRQPMAYASSLNTMRAQAANWGQQRYMDALQLAQPCTGTLLAKWSYCPKP